MALTIDNLISEVVSASAMDQLQLAQAKLNVLLSMERREMDIERREMDIERQNRETEKFEIEKQREKDRKKMEGIRSIMDLTRYQDNVSPTIKKEIKDLKNIVEIVSGLEKGSVENYLYLHTTLSGGDGRDPIGLVNNDTNSLIINATMRVSPDSNSDIVSLINGEWRIKIRDDKDNIYDIINIKFVNGQASFEYTTNNKPAECYVSEEDFDPLVFGNDTYSVKLVNEVNFVVYKILTNKG